YRKPSTSPSPIFSIETTDSSMIDSGIRNKVPMIVPKPKMASEVIAPSVFLITMEYNAQRMTATIMIKSPTLNSSPKSRSKDPCVRIHSTPIMLKNMETNKFQVSLSLMIKKERININKGV